MKNRGEESMELTQVVLFPKENTRGTTREEDADQLGGWKWGTDLYKKSAMMYKYKNILRKHYCILTKNSNNTQKNPKETKTKPNQMKPNKQTI